MPTSVNVVREPSKRREINVFQPYRLRFIVKVFATPWRSVLQIDTVKRNSSKTFGSCERSQHPILNWQERTTSRSNVLLDLVEQLSIMAQRMPNVGVE